MPKAAALEELRKVCFYSDGQWTTDKPLGADAIGEVVNILLRHGLGPKENHEKQGSKARRPSGSTGKLVKSKGCRASPRS